MTPFFRPACLALVIVAAAVPARAQNWVYESDTAGPVYQPRIYDRGYIPAADLVPPAYDNHGYVEPGYAAPGYVEPGYVPPARVVVGPAPLALTPIQRTTIYRTIIPQGYGIGPIVRERIVTETIPAAPVVGAPVVGAPVVGAPLVDGPVVGGPVVGGPVVGRPVVRPRVVAAPVVRPRVGVGAYAADYAVGSRIADSYALAPLPPAAIATAPAVRSYRYVVINDRVLLVNPVTGVIVADLTQ